MPVLHLETFVFPDHIFAEEADWDIANRWWVLHTKPRAEKALARRMHASDISFFLPCFERSRSGRRGTASSYLPLFPGYFFLKGTHDDRLAALATDLVVSSLTVADPFRLHTELNRVHRLLAAPSPLHPESRLRPGTLVEIIAGPLSGLTGTLVRKGKQTRFFVEVEMLRRGVSIELEDWMFRPVN